MNNFECFIDDFPENIALEKDSGCWGIRGSDCSLILDQLTNESLSEFIERCYEHFKSRNELLSQQF